jgi:hypothetical protein
MAAIQLSFNLRISSNVKTVHLLGSWDNYSGQLPLTKNSEKSGGWKGTFRFQGSTLSQGSRYWYYYIIDGYHVSHDPGQPSTKESTTGRMLNILDVPASAQGPVDSSASAKKSSSDRRRRNTIAKGRPLSVSKIEHPRPVKPNQTRYIIDSADSDVDSLTEQFKETELVDYYNESDSLVSSSPSSVGSLSSLSSRSDSANSLSSASDLSNCSCERYGITRRGDRVKLDCGGSRCGYSDDESSSCCSSEESEDEAKFVKSSKATRRQGVVIRR